MQIGETHTQNIVIDVKSKGQLAITVKLFYSIPIDGEPDIQLPQEAVSIHLCWPDLALNDNLHVI